MYFWTSDRYASFTLLIAFLIDVFHIVQLKDEKIRWLEKYVELRDGGSSKSVKSAGIVRLSEEVVSSFPATPWLHVDVPLAS